MGLEVGGYEKRKSLCRAINCFASTSVNIYQILINWSLAKTTFYYNICMAKDKLPQVRGKIYNICIAKPRVSQIRWEGEGEQHLYG
jgi:hypothetical protein